MNYQDFESAWYLGLIVTSVFCVGLVGYLMAVRRLPRLWAAGDPFSAWLTVAATTFTMLFMVGICLGTLIGIVVLGSG